MFAFSGAQHHFWCTPQFKFNLAATRRRASLFFAARALRWLRLTAAKFLVVAFRRRERAISRLLSALNCAAAIVGASAFFVDFRGARFFREAKISAIGAYSRESAATLPPHDWSRDVSRLQLAVARHSHASENKRRVCKRQAALLLVAAVGRRPALDAHRPRRRCSRLPTLAPKRRQRRKSSSSSLEFEFQLPGAESGGNRDFFWRRFGGSRVERARFGPRRQRFVCLSRTRRGAPTDAACRLPRCRGSSR